MKRSIAIIGSGHAGLLAAHGLLRAGYDVTVYTDRTQEQWLNEARPTGSAMRMALGLDYERSLGLGHWDDVAPKITGAHLTVCEAPGNRLLTMAGRMSRPGMALDLRLQCARWMNDFEALGGNLVPEAVDRARLDAIASEHELTIVATGRGDLAQIFERDAERSIYDRPQRKVAMIITKGARMGFEGIPFLPIRFNLFTTMGETFWIPYYHKDHGPTFNLVVEARPGSPFDRFQGAKSGDEVLARTKELIREFIPWDAEWARDMELADPNGWLVGAVTPFVRKPVSVLSSGRVVTALGDAAMAVDPITGQGANNGSKMAQNLVESIIARGALPYDAAFLTATFDRFYARHGGPCNLFTSTLLEPISDAAKELLIAQYGSTGIGHDVRQEIADAVVENFVDPATLTDATRDMHLARAFIEEKTGKSWLFSAAAGRLAIAAGQIRQALGLPPQHPQAAMNVMAHA